MTLLGVAAVAFGCLALAWVVYPLVMWLRARKVVPAASTEGPPGARVCAIVATRDEPRFAVHRVRNLLDTDYPGDLLDVVVAVDPGAQAPAGAYREALTGLATVVVGDPPGGKATTLNAGVRAAGKAELLLFADVGQEFNRQAIPQLVAALASDRCGAVTGRYVQRPDDSTMVAYAGLEAMIRSGQAAGRGVVSASGSILALRAEFWRPLPAGLICDDLFTGLSVVRQGQRLGFCADALAVDRRSFTREQQFTRRVRTLTGLIQYLHEAPWSLNPWKNPVWIHFILHKVFRLLTPLFAAVGALALSAWLMLAAPLVLVVGLAVSVALFLVAGLMVPGGPRRLWADMRWLLRLQLVPLLAIGNAIRGRWTVWTVTPQHPGEARPGAGAA